MEFAKSVLILNLHDRKHIRVGNGSILRGQMKLNYFGHVSRDAYRVRIPEKWSPIARRSHNKIGDPLIPLSPEIL